MVAGGGDVASTTFTSKSWKLGFDDEFTGFDLDQTKWNYRPLGIQSGDSGRSKSESSADAVDVENGALRLSTLENPASPSSHLNGHVGTENTYSFTYGVSAARIKFQKPSGMHGSFWMQSPIFGSVANPIAVTTTAPSVAPIIGITSSSATTRASATAYSPRPTMNRKISDDSPAQNPTMKAPET